MYYPYLRARQFELIALRELVTESTHHDLVIPVIEPVRKSMNSLNRANEIFTENDFFPYLVVNPLEGDVTGDSNYMLDYRKNMETCSFLPAFHFTNSDFIEESIEKYELENCMLICLEGFADNSSLRDLCNNAAIQKVVVLDPQKNRALDHFLKETGKSYIRLDDVFERQKKNADYLGIPANKLTEEHLYFRNEGYAGFSDFTVLPSEFTIGGATPRAVVIHLSYVDKENNSEIWIRHFTSETGSDSIVNVQGKFKEAARKALEFCNEMGLENTAIAELQDYYTNEKYPGLGIIKKISIKNHLITVRNYLLEHHE